MDVHWDQSGDLPEKEITILNTMFKTKDQEDYIADWRKNIHNFSILRSFLLFKFDFHREPCMRDFKLRRSLRQLHLSSHKLAIEKGRHCRPKLALENRICIYCDVMWKMNCVSNCLNCFSFRR